MQDSVVITWSDFGYIPFMWHLSSFCTSINLVISSGEARAITSDNGPLSRVQSNTVLFRHSLYLIVGHSYHFLNKYENNERLVLGTWSITFSIITIIIFFLINDRMALSASILISWQMISGSTQFQFRNSNFIKDDYNYTLKFSLTYFLNTLHRHPPLFKYKEQILKYI